MRLWNVCVVLALAFAFAILSPAYSQYDANTAGTLDMSRFNLHAGAFFPVGDTVNSAEPMVGVEYEFPVGALLSNLPGKLSLSADVTSIESRTVDGTDRSTLVPIFLNYKHSLAPAAASYWDLGVGVGMYWALDDIPDMRVGSGVKFAYQATAAYHFAPHYFLEGRFLASTHAGDDAMWGVDLGYSF